MKIAERLVFQMGVNDAVVAGLKPRVESSNEATNPSTSVNPLSNIRRVSSGVRLCSNSRVSWVSLAILRF